MDRTGLQLGQCLDTTNPADPCVIWECSGEVRRRRRFRSRRARLFPDNFPTNFLLAPPPPTSPTLAASRPGGLGDEHAGGFGRTLTGSGGTIGAGARRVACTRQSAKPACVLITRPPGLRRRQCWRCRRWCANRKIRLGSCPERRRARGFGIRRRRRTSRTTPITHGSAGFVVSKGTAELQASPVHVTTGGNPVTGSMAPTAAKPWRSGADAQPPVKMMRNRIADREMTMSTRHASLSYLRREDFGAQRRRQKCMRTFQRHAAGSRCRSIF